MKHLRKWSYWLAKLLPHPIIFRGARLLNRVQLDHLEIDAIARVVRQKSPCRFLVFGFGNDSYFWHILNRNGENVFLENNPHWYQKVKQQHPQINGYMVTYGTRVPQWRALFDNPEKLVMDLPEAVTREKFDVILVDAPNGYEPDSPGRMMSIYTAAQLVKSGGDIFVHDFNREIEREYSDRFLGQEKLISEVHLLRHYHLP